jgi:hypothetical protein
MEDDRPLHILAAKCRELAETCTTAFARDSLYEMSVEFELRAEDAKTHSSRGVPKPMFVPPKE